MDALKVTFQDFVYTTFFYMPNALFLYGFINDMLTQEYKYSPSGITALFGIFINYLVGKRFPRQLPIPAATSASPIPIAPSLGERNTLCYLPGFQDFENSLAPQSIVMTTTVLFYYLIDIWKTNPSKSIAASIGFAVILLLQVVSLSTIKCFEYYNYGIYSSAIAVFMGILFAVCGYFIGNLVNDSISAAIHKTTGTTPSSSSTNIVCPPGQIRVKGVCKNVSSVSVGESDKEQTCSKDIEDGDYELVGELFKDGQLITSSIVD